VDSRVKWLPGERAGRPAVPRNRGIAASKGEWIAFLDDDDEWLPEKLEEQLRMSQKLHCFAACGNAHRYVPGYDDVRDYSTDNDRKRITFEDLLLNNSVICSSALVHRSVILKAGGFPEGVGLRALEDYALWLRIAVFTDFAYLNVPMLRYRDDAVSSIRGCGVTVMEQRKRVFNDFLEWGSFNKVPKVFTLEVERRKKEERSERLIGLVLRPLKYLRRALLS